MIKQFTFLTLICTSLILTSCGPSAADKVGDAQLCLDTATASTVSSCVEKVAGLETSGAYLIRCSANFIQKGFGDPAQLVNAFRNLDSTGSGTTTAFLGALNFADNTFATQTYDYCLKTNQRGLSLLAAMVKSATSIAVLGNLISGSCSTSTSSSSGMQTCISSIVSSIGTSNGQSAAAAVGQSVVDIYQTSCQNGSQVSSSLCTQMSSAITSAGGSSNATNVGTAILNAWQSQ